MAATPATMLRALLAGLAGLHLGPGLAFAVLAFGCEPASPLLGELCRRGTLEAFLGLTLAFWLVLAVAALGWRAWRGRTR